MSKVSVVIGKNFGDEGKGLITDYLCQCQEKALVIKHNGGAQAGHTVDRMQDRFVFHQLSSGSFRGAETFWAKTYFPDLYKLEEEREQFRALTGFVPDIYCDKATNTVIIDDVLVNMLSETLRGDNRHGSCGMGINESFLRTKAGYGVRISEVAAHSAEYLANILKDIRRDYVWPRIQSEITDQSLQGEYGELLRSDTVLENVVEDMVRHCEKINFVGDVSPFVAAYENIVFESGQGLLLDTDYEKYAPHLTTSKTGLSNPVALSREWGLSIDEICYVTRSYVTRHGAGPLEYECKPSELGLVGEDATNVFNPWQGQIRYGKHSDLDGFVEPVREDYENVFSDHHRSNISECLSKLPKRHLFVTHLNETGGMLCMAQGDLSMESFVGKKQVTDQFDGIFTSDSPYAEDVRKFILQI